MTNLEEMQERQLACGEKQAKKMVLGGKSSRKRQERSYEPEFAIPSDEEETPRLAKKRKCVRDAGPEGIPMSSGHWRLLLEYAFEH